MSDKKMILVVEDDVQMLGFNERKLRRAGYTVVTAQSIAEALEKFNENIFDLMVLDVMLPDGSGFDLCKKIRLTSDSPILFLTGKTQTEDKVTGLLGGGDYYMTKPYDFDELVAVVKTLLRRVEKNDSANIDVDIITYKDLTLNKLTLIASANNTDLLLTPKEFSLLMVLAKNIDNPICAKDLYENAFSVPFHDDIRTLWTHLSRLRKKLEANSDIIIQNDRSTGYSLY